MVVRRIAVGVLASLAVFAPATAGAQDYPGGTTDERVLSDQQDRPAADPGTGAVAAAQQTLPVTGGDLLGLTVLGVGLVGGGAVVVRRSRRRAVTA